MNKKGSAKFIQLNKEYEAPIVKPQENYDFIKYGDNNNFPDELVQLLATSGLHSSIVNKKVSMLLGKGLKTEDISPETLNFILNPNPYEDLNSIMEKCAWDLEIQGGFYLQMIWDPNTKKIHEIYHMDATRMRVNNPNEFGFSTTAYYYNDLKQPVNNFYDIQDTVSFPLFNKSEINMTEPQIFHAYKYNPTNKYYGSPSYQASILDIQTYAEISNFHNSNLHNNFSPGFLIMFTGTPPSDELQDDIVKELKSKYAGTEQTGTPLLFFLEEGMEIPEIKPIDVSDLDKQFEQLIKQIINNIAMAHQIPKQVVGIETSGSLGSSKEMLEATQIFRSDYIEPQQQTLLSVFNQISLINGFDDFELINPSPNIMLFNMTDLVKILSVDEIRNYLGYEPQNKQINNE